MAHRDEYQKLKEDWYKKLKESGFKDIETADGRLEQWDSVYFYKRYNPTTAANKEGYYRLVGQFLYEYKFKNKLDKEIWTLHSEGLSNIEIAKRFATIESERGVKRESIRTTIVRLRTIMYKLYGVTHE